MVKETRIIIVISLLAGSKCLAFAPFLPHKHDCSRNDNHLDLAICNSRRQQRYYEEDDQDETYLIQTRTFEPGPQLEISSRLEDDEEYFYEDNADSADNADDADDYTREENELPDSRSLPTGNYWSNPKEELDNYPSQPRSTRRPLPPSTALPHQRQQRQQRSDNWALAPSRVGSRTTFRSGTPPPPRSIKDMYDRFFWFGFDPDVDDASPEGFDKTVFGGTKGKFDGLSYLGEFDGSQASKQRRSRLPRIMDFDDDGDYFDEADETLIESQQEKILRTNAIDKLDFQERQQRALEPRDEPPLRGDGYYDETRRTNTRQSQWRGDILEDDASDWYDQLERKPDGVRGRKRERSRNQNPLAKGFTGFLDDIFNFDKGKMESKAAAYDRQLGRGLLEPDKRHRSGERRPRDSRYDYSYDSTQPDDIPPDNYFDSDNDEQLANDLTLDVDAQVEEVIHMNQVRPPRKERTWEERAIAYDRVPPAGVAAWGPSGDLGIDTRTKATLDALEEIREAKRKVDYKREKVEEAKEDVLIIKADAEITKKRAIREDPRRISAQMLQIELQLEDAARFLRRARNEEDRAMDDLDALEDRHWALLSMYDADKAVQEVVRSFEVLREEEPATRVNTGVDNDFIEDENKTEEMSEDDEN